MKPQFFEDDAGKPPALICYRENADGPKDRNANVQLQPPYMPASAAPQVKPQDIPGLIGRIVQYILKSSHYPNEDIALAASIGFLSGICGREFQTYTKAGLNNYILVLAMTGMGKDQIALSLTRLLNEVIKSVPAASTFKGPGELVSSAGLIKWLVKNPAVFSILGEFGLLLSQMADPKANSHMKGLERILLQLYSKSSHGNVLDPMAYSDGDKNTPPVLSPSFTMICEAEPRRFYELLSPQMIESGVLPRFMPFEVVQHRPYEQEDRIDEPPGDLVQSIADLCAEVLRRADQASNVRVPHIVPANAEAVDKFREFERFTTDQINSAGNEGSRQLWNRARLKALKLATLCAIGINPYNPIVTIDETMWATELVAKQTWSLIARFEKGETGRVAGNQTRQEREVLRVLADYHSKPFNTKYNGTEEMHRAGVITQSHISQRLSGVTAFSQDPRGAKDALTRTLKSLLEADVIREVPRAQMVTNFNGKHPVAFVVSDPAAVLKAASQ